MWSCNRQTAPRNILQGAFDLQLDDLFLVSSTLCQTTQIVLLSVYSVLKLDLKQVISLAD
jgi:hypothetical protein